jgi:hypothetical protein
MWAREKTRDDPYKRPAEEQHKKRKKDRGETKEQRKKNVRQREPERKRERQNPVLTNDNSMYSCNSLLFIRTQ